MRVCGTNRLTPIYVVLGMHRSGTSVIARGLEALGVALGDNLMPPAGSNEKGFFEDLDIYRLNERILLKSNSAWHKLAPLDATALTGAAFASERREATALLLQKASTRAFGFKDPRTSILLPFWQAVFDELGIDDRYVIAVRNPMESAASLEARDGIAAPKGLMLWGKHIVEALHHTAQRRRICVSYDRVLHDAGHELHRMAEAFNLKPPALDSDAVKAYRDEFLTPALRHHRFDLHALTSRAPAFIAELHEIAETLAATSGPVDQSRWRCILRRHDELAPTFAYADRLDDERRAALVALTRTTQERDEALKRLDQQRGEIKAIKASTSWRLTAPMRWVKDQCRGAARAFRRAARRALDAKLRRMNAHR